MKMALLTPALENHQGGPCLGIMWCVLVEDIVIPLENPERFRKALLCMSPKFVRYIKYGLWVVESSASMTRHFLNMALESPESEEPVVLIKNAEFNTSSRNSESVVLEGELVLLNDK